MQNLENHENRLRRWSIAKIGPNILSNFPWVNLLCWVSMVWAINSAAQECTIPEETCTDDGFCVITLNSQQAVDDFQSVYGPCNVIIAELRINGEDITDLTPLQDLVRIGNPDDFHGLDVSSNPMLESLNGLHNIRTIGAGLEISFNPLLTDLTGLNALEDAGRTFEVQGNDNLLNLEGLDSLKTSYFFWFVVSFNPKLESLQSYLGSESTDIHLLQIEGNPSLQSLEGLPLVETNHLDVTDHIHVYINNNENLKNLKGLNLTGTEDTKTPSIQRGILEEDAEAARKPWIDLQICSNKSLESLQDLEVSGNYVGGTIRLCEIDSLEDLQGLEWAIDTSFSLADAPNVKSLVGLNNLARASGLSISNTALTSLSGLESLQQVGSINEAGEYRGELRIWQNSELANLGGLVNLIASGDLTVGHNPKLSDCTGLSRLLDVIDHGMPGPGIGPLEYFSNVYHIPDVQGNLLLTDNDSGCDTIEDIAPPEPIVERVLTGSWYDPDSSGEGFMIHAVQAHSVNPFANEVGLAIGYFYGYDENGDRFWLIGVHEGDMQWDEPIEFTASYVEGGNFEDFDPDDVTESPWGTFTFTPLHCDAATMVLQGKFDEEGGVQQKTLNVLRLGKVSGDYCTEQTSQGYSDTLTASWFDSGKAGEGFAFHKIDDDTGIVYFYGFDANGKPLWLIGVWSGQVELGEPIEIPMAQVSGGFFEEVDPENIVEEPWGTLELEMSECDSGQAILSGIDGEQVFAIEQLASSLGLECP